MARRLLERTGEPWRESEKNRTALAGFYLLLTVAAGWLMLLSAGGDNAFIYFQF